VRRLRCTLLAATGVALMQLVAATGVTAAETPSAGAAAPGAAALGHCAAIAADDARLACYDALAGRAATISVVPAPAATPAPTAAVVAAPAAASDPQNFGIAQVRVPVPEAPKGPAAIEAHVAQVFDNGVARASVVLDNGQTWIFAESFADASLSPGDAVTIKRAALGSFLLVTPAHHSYHVHRVQ
jgi:hypothetical protein